MHRLIAVGGKLVWKTGVVLERDGSRAEIVEEYFQRRIRVRETAAMHIMDCLQSWINNWSGWARSRLEYDRFLPCPCPECQGKAEPYSFSLDKLMKMAKKSQSIQCHISGEMVDAARLVREILPGALRREEFGTDPSPSQTTLQKSSAPPTLEVFVSYAWNSESRAIVDRLQQVLDQQGDCADS